MIDVSRPNRDSSKSIISDKGRLSMADKYDGRISFILNMDASGSTALFREERVSISDKLLEKLQVHYGSKDLSLFSKLKDINNVVSVKWKMGDLLFNRKEHK
jgi:hypothetical protein